MSSCEDWNNIVQIKSRELAIHALTTGVLVVHVTCLSLLCRWLHTSPKNLWSGLLGTGSKYAARDWVHFAGRPLASIHYYQMEERWEQEFLYVKEEYNKEIKQFIHDIDSIDECNWLLATPAIFPVVPLRPLPLPLVAVAQIQTPFERLINAAELFFRILDFLVPYIPIETLMSELKSSGESLLDSLSIPRAQASLFSLLRTNKMIYNTITQNRQDLFFRLVWMHGWMLPACPADWKSWDKVNDPLPPLTGVPRTDIPSFNPNRLTSSPHERDWRAYLVSALRFDSRHMRNRFRFHRMHIQFARHVYRTTEDDLEHSSVFGGSLGVRTSLDCPVPYEWEDEEWIPETDSEEDR